MSKTSWLDKCSVQLIFINLLQIHISNNSSHWMSTFLSYAHEFVGIKHGMFIVAMLQGWDWQAERRVAAAAWSWAEGNCWSADVAQRFWGSGYEAGLAAQSQRSFTRGRITHIELLLLPLCLFDLFYAYSFKNFDFIFSVYCYWMTWKCICWKYPTPSILSEIHLMWSKLGRKLVKQMHSTLWSKKRHTLLFHCGFYKHWPMSIIRYLAHSVLS